MDNRMLGAVVHADITTPLEAVMMHEAVYTVYILYILTEDGVLLCVLLAAVQS